MTATAQPRRGELYLRGDTYGTFDAQQAILNRVRTLEADGVLASSRAGARRAVSNGVLDEADVAGEWQRIRTLDEDRRDGAIATYREFEDWAERNDHSLSPAFERRTRAYMGIDRVDEVVVFPVVSLAMYDGRRLQAVFPCADGDETYTVQDCLDALERGDEGWLAQFDGVAVNRTEPMLEVGLEA